MNPPDILKKIVEYKIQFVNARKHELPLPVLQNKISAAAKVRDFTLAIQNKLLAKKLAVIAEIKKASPSKGILRPNFNPTEIAKSYAANGATCLSVLTDAEYFHGSDEHLQLARAACDLPILRKDFIIDPYQIYESRILGADCILLIAAILTDQELMQFTKLATDLGMAVLVEAHDKEELQRALALPTKLIGINNRDLRTFNTDLNTTIQLAQKIPADKIIITESGINTRADVLLMLQHQIKTFLIGETFMREVDPGKKLAELIGEFNNERST